MTEDYHKYAHVRGAKVDADDNHTCHWPGCHVQVPRAMWGCKGHWLSLPKILRDRIWAAYTIGQEKDASLVTQEYLDAATAVQEWIASYQRANESKRPRN